MTTREATHAGSWYSSDPEKLSDELKQLLNRSNQECLNARFSFGPHAGYTYCGKILANTYKVLNPELKRLFIIGPSHHVYFKGCVLTTTCTAYESPIGDVKVDTETIDELIDYDSKLFRKMNLGVDEDEHSLEMHIPFIKQCLPHVEIVPILVGAANHEFLTKVSKALKPYVSDSNTGFVVSSDFCHWGERFSYTSYTPTGHITDLKGKVGDRTSGKIHKGDGIPIYKSIKALDEAALDALKSGSVRKWMDYLYVTENTICGAKPLALLLMLAEDGFVCSGYSQSGKVVDSSGSSVSYASGHVG